MDDASFGTHIANQACIFIYVNPGTYTRKSISACDSHTDGTMRHIALYRNNDLHPAMPSDGEQADVPLTFIEEAANWIVDRIFVLSNSGDWATCIIVRSSSRNILLNRLHIRDFFDGITIFGRSDATDFNSGITSRTQDWTR